MEMRYPYFIMDILMFLQDINIYLTGNVVLLRNTTKGYILATPSNNGLIFFS